MILLAVLEVQSSSIRAPLRLCFNDCGSGWPRLCTWSWVHGCCKSPTGYKLLKKTKTKKKLVAESSIQLAELSALSTLLPRLNKARLSSPPPPLPHLAPKLFSPPLFPPVFLPHSCATSQARGISVRRCRWCVYGYA